MAVQLRDDDGEPDHAGMIEVIGDLLGGFCCTIMAIRN